MKCKGKAFIGFGFVKVMQLTNREGLNCKVEGGDECPSLGHLAGHGGEREGDILGKMEFWEIEILVDCGGRKERK